MTKAVTQASTSIFTWLARRLNLRFPVLVSILAILTIADAIIPDFIPFVDEIGLALLTLIVGSWKKRIAAPDPAPPNQA